MTAAAHARYTEGTGVRPRSAAARLEATLARQWKALEHKMGRALTETWVYTDPYKVRDGDGHSSTAVLAQRGEDDAAARIAGVLANAAHGAGVSHEGLAPAQERWRRLAREDIERWRETSGPWPAWEHALEAVRRLGENAPRRVTLARWALLTRGGAPLAERIARAEPWLAAEAVRTLEPSVLVQPVREWRRAVVRAHARALGREDPISDADADAALEHWRWPNARPGLAVASAGAGVLAPLASESAWANALAADPAEGLLRDALTWARAVREGEEGVRETVAGTVRAIASTWMRSCGEDEATLERWEALWAANPHLPGDGRRIAPVFAPGAGKANALGWDIPIEGPRALCARAALTGERPGDVMATVAARTNEPRAARGWRPRAEPAKVRIVSHTSARWRSTNDAGRPWTPATRRKTCDAHWAGAPLDEMDACAERRRPAGEGRAHPPGRSARARGEARAKARAERAARATGAVGADEGRRTGEVWAVDASRNPIGEWWWALVDPALSVARTGHFTPHECGGDGATHAEARAVHEALASVACGATLTTDATGVVERVAKAESDGGATAWEGVEGAIALALAEREVTLEWRPRIDPGIAAADHAARCAGKHDARTRRRQR